MGVITFALLVLPGSMLAVEPHVGPIFTVPKAGAWFTTNGEPELPEPWLAGEQEATEAILSQPKAYQALVVTSPEEVV